MADFKPDEELEAQEFESIESEGRQVPDWVKTLGKVLAGLAIVVLLVLGGRWVNQQLSRDTTDKPAPTATKQSPTAKQPTESTTPSGGSGTTTGGGASTGGGGASATTGQDQNLKSQTGGNIPNTGPGDVAAIFLGASFIAGALHYAVAQRRIG